MKHRLLFILVFQFLFLGCNLVDHVPPTNLNLKKNIVGKWVFESWGGYPLLDYAFTEFTENGDFILYDGLGLDTFDKYKLLSETQIAVNSVVSISDIKISDKRITFNLTRKTGTAFIIANKADVVDDTEKARLLTSTNWNMLRELDGKDSLKYLSKSTTLFTTSGTCLNLFDQTGNIYQGTYYLTWKWHPTVPDRILFSRIGGFPIKEEDRYVTVKKVTETNLSLSETKRLSVRNYEYVPDK